MKCFILIAIFVLTVNVGDVSGGWWRKVKASARDVWQRNRERIIQTGLGILLSGRSAADLDVNGDGILDSSELSQHMSERDIEEMMSTLGTDEVSEENLKRYVSDHILDDTM